VAIAVVVLGGLAGIAIAGRPSSVDDRVITAPSTSASPTASSAVDTTVPTTDTSTAATSTVPSTATPTTEAIDRTAVRVLVANAGSRSGMASATAERLVQAGFTDSRPSDALSTRDESVVYAREGFETAAAQIALTLGLAPEIVLPLPDSDITPKDDSADVIVVLAEDFAG
jgi:hypothetical protein